MNETPISPSLSLSLSPSLGSLRTHKISLQMKLATRFSGGFLHASKCTFSHQSAIVGKDPCQKGVKNQGAEDSIRRSCREWGKCFLISIRVFLSPSLAHLGKRWFSDVSSTEVKMDVTDKGVRSLPSVRVRC
jgi:hypothetical protein